MRRLLSNTILSLAVFAAVFISTPIFATHVFASPAAAQEAQSQAQTRPFRQTYTIEIDVECIDTAMDIIRQLNGYNLQSVIATQEHSRQGTLRHADIVRRVDTWAFRQVQEVLRGLGDVRQESEHAVFLGAQLTDTEARIAAVSQEIDRLTLMMAASDSLQSLITIDARLSQINRDRNELIGRRNVLLAQAASPVITIWLREIPEDFVPQAPPGFGTRVADSFMGSWNATRNFAAGLLVFIVRISMPLVALSAIVGCILFLGFPAYKKRMARKTDKSNKTDTHEVGEGEA